MCTKRLAACLLVVAASALTAFAGSSLFAHWSIENPSTDPNNNPKPVNPDDASQGFLWKPVADGGIWVGSAPAVVEGYTITGTIGAGEITIGKNKYRRIGLDNRYLGEEWIKTVVVEFDYAGGVPSFPGSANGNHPKHRPNPSIEYDHTSLIDPLLLHARFTYKIKPQPDWHWVTVFNESATKDLILGQVTIKTTCVPEPATLALLVLGALVGVRRQR